MLQRGNSGDGCELTSTLCKYELRKGDLFVPSWARQKLYVVMVVCISYLNSCLCV